MKTRRGPNVRTWYAGVVRLYPRAYRDRFGEGMLQTFNDLLRERRDKREGLSRFALWLFVETFAGALKEHMNEMNARIRGANRLVLVVTAVTSAILAVTYVANGFDDEWLYLTAWFCSLVGLWVSTGRGKTIEPGE